MVDKLAAAAGDAVGLAAADFEECEPYWSEEATAAAADDRGTELMYM